MQTIIPDIAGFYVGFNFIWRLKDLSIQCSGQLLEKLERMDDVLSCNFEHPIRNHQRTTC